jgi:hypothetical protein
MPKTESKQQLGVRGEELACAELERQCIRCCNEIGAAGSESRSCWFGRQSSGISSVPPKRFPQPPKNTCSIYTR